MNTLFTSTARTHTATTMSVRTAAAFLDTVAATTAAAV